MKNSPPNAPNYDPGFPAVSVIVTTYNRLSLLKETISSILAQTFLGYELLIIDNCSNDGTEQYVEELASKYSNVRYFRNNNNGVIAINRNIGLNNAKGDLVAFCDDDDLWEANKLEVQMQAFQDNPNLALCSTRFRQFNKNIIEPVSSDKVRELTIQKLFWRNMICTSSVVIRRKNALEVGGFDCTRRYAPYDDFDFWLRFVADGLAIRLPDQLVLYRVHDSNHSPNQRKGVELAFRIRLDAYRSLKLSGCWYWICIYVRLMQYTYLTLRDYLNEVLRLFSSK